MDSENPTWSDIKSITMTRDDYFAEFKEKAEIKSNFESYTLKMKIIGEIRTLLKIHDEHLKILAIGAGWCKDCTSNIPKLIKIADSLPSERVQLRLLYGIRVNPYRKSGEPIWSKEHSPPEAFDPKFMVTKIPMIYFFNKAGKFLGKIIENPTEYPTIEECILSFLKEHS